MPNIVADFPASPPPPADGKLKLHNTLATNVTIISLLFSFLAKSPVQPSPKPLQILYPGSWSQMGQSINKAPTSESLQLKRCEIICYTHTHLKSWRQKAWSFQEDFGETCVAACIFLLRREAKKTREIWGKIGLIQALASDARWTLWRSIRETKDKNIWA